MLVGQKLLFVHYPRTGGTSVRNHLTRLVPDQYYPNNDPHLIREKKVALIHQSLVVCHQYTRHVGLNPLTIPTLVTIRNPYSLMLSEYMYLKQKWGKKIKDLEKTFTAYLVNMDKKVTPQKRQKWLADEYGRYQDYLCVNGRTPANLTIARYETLAQDVNAFLAEKLNIVDEKAKLPHKNASRHGEIKNYFTDKEEKLVYSLWQNAFDSGLYKRFDGLE